MIAAHLAADYSLEITSRDANHLFEARDLLPVGSPVSITFLPRDTASGICEMATTIRKFGFEPVPHISARRLGSQRELDELLRRLRGDADVTRVFVVAGDVTQALGPYE